MTTKKNFLFFCSVTLLTVFLLGCNGVPALAAPIDTKVNSVETKEEGKTTEKMTFKKTFAKTNKKKVSKQKTKKKKSKKTIKIESYIKNGKFDYISYYKAVGAYAINVERIGLNLIFKEGYFLTISTDKQEDENEDRYLIAVGYISEDFSESDITYFDIRKDWGDLVDFTEDAHLSFNGLKKLHKTVLYMAKNHDPYKKPKVKGIDWKEGKDFDKYNNGE